MDAVLNGVSVFPSFAESLHLTRVFLGSCIDLRQPHAPEYSPCWIVQIPADDNSKWLNLYCGDRSSVGVESLRKHKDETRGSLTAKHVDSLVTFRDRLPQSVIMLNRQELQMVFLSSTAHTPSVTGASSAEIVSGSIRWCCFIRSY